jgi:hypothetical protein
MKGLVNCNFLPGSARRLELGYVLVVTPASLDIGRIGAPPLTLRVCEIGSRRNVFRDYSLWP